jgi:hypothetical protein
MLRRTLALAAVVLALTSAPALAYQYHSQLKYGTHTSSRSAGGCRLSNGWWPGSLKVECPSHKHATLTYTFPTRKRAHGRVRLHVDGDGSANVEGRVSVGKSALTVTLTVTGAGSFQVGSVSVWYYA